MRVKWNKKLKYLHTKRNHPNSIKEYCIPTNKKQKFKNDFSHDLLNI